MQFVQFYAINHLTGAALPGAMVTVYVANTASPAVLYNGDGVQISNPFLADAIGLVGFSTTDGVYDIQIVSGPYTAPPISNLTIFDVFVLADTVNDFNLAAAVGVTHSYTTRALLYADLAPGNAELAQVYADANLDYRGIYSKVGATGTGSWNQIVYNSAAAAIAVRQQASNDSRLVERLSNPSMINRFDLSRISAGKSINPGTGGENTTSGFFASGFIPAAEGDTQAARRDIYNIAFFKPDGSYLSGMPAPGGPVVPSGGYFTVPAGAASYRFDGPNAYLREQVLSYGMTAAVNYIPFGDPLRIFARVTQNARLSVPEIVGLFDKSRAAVDYRINPTTGQQEAFSGFTASHLIPVSAGDVLCDGDFACYDYALLDTNQNLLTGVGTGSPVLNDTDTVTVTQDGYFCFDFPNAYLDQAYLVRGATRPPWYAQFGGYLNRSAYPWHQKKIIFFGDSMTAQVSGLGKYLIANAVCRTLGAEIGAVYATAGYRIDQITPWITAPNMAGMAAAHVFCGTNTFGSGRTLGAYGDAPGTATVYGDLGGMFQAFATVAPSCRVVFFTPLKRTLSPAWDANNSAGWKMIALHDAILRVAADWGVFVSDDFNNSGYNTVTIPTLTGDGLHPLDPGYTALGNQHGLVMNGIGQLV